MIDFEHFGHIGDGEDIEYFPHILDAHFVDFRHFGHIGHGEDIGDFPNTLDAHSADFRDSVYIEEFPNISKIHNSDNLYDQAIDSSTYQVSIAQEEFEAFS